MLGIPYEPQRFVITAKNIDTFILSRFRRNIRKAHVNSILASLLAGKHFHAPISVFTTNGSKNKEAIDGNHRLVGLKEWLEEEPTKSIEVLLLVYKLNGTKEKIENELREIFHVLNIPLRQNTDDFIIAYKNEIPIYESLCGTHRIVPCSVYGNRDEIKLKLLVGAYMIAKNNPIKFIGTIIEPPEQFVNDMKRLKYSDALVMKDFWDDYMKMFDVNPSVQNIKGLTCMKTTAVFAMFYLWYHNKDRLGRKYLIDRVSNVLAGTDYFDEWATRPGTKLSKEAYDAFVRRMNKGLHTGSKNFVT